ncbi:MAG TPA: YtxH domain-containing protein [Candidatus Bathyarchaeia archaeon]|nr:YtxH domain-containing protein [Candidatus Bathyarchaeia archaeon]
MEDQAYDYASQGEYRSSGNNISVALTMLFIGLAAGAITALLLAPKTGRQMRRSLRRKVEDARDAVDGFTDQAGGWFDKGSDWAEKAKDRVAQFKKR